MALDGAQKISLSDDATGCPADINFPFIISDGDIYEYEGKMKVFEFNVPATDSDNEEKISWDIGSDKNKSYPHSRE